jgi:hypothetical protein
MRIRLLLSLALLPVALLAQPASAQFLYKSTMPDGKVIYGDQPTPGAVKVEKTKPDTSKKGIVPATGSDAAALKKMETESAARNAVGDRTRALEETLRKLEAGREAAREPLEGERIGSVGAKGGGSRFTDAYWERQKKLDEGIETVRQEIEKSRAAR